MVDWQNVPHLLMVLALTLTLVLTLELVADSASQPYNIMVMVGYFPYLRIAVVIIVGAAVVLFSS